MNYRSFEDLPVWRAAIDFALLIFEFTEKYNTQFRGLGDTKNQLERAAVSISNNIAEGFERGSNSELINFLYISRGSSGESRSVLALCHRVPRFGGARSEIANLKGRANNISSQLFGWIESLKNSPEKGERHFTVKEKARRRAAEEREQYIRELDERIERSRIEREGNT